MAALPKRELLRQIGKFLKDPDRGISIPMFGELCGVSKDTLRDVFINHTEPLSEMVQRRVNMGYEQWKAGRVRVMKRTDNTRYVDYRRVAEPVFIPTMGLKFDSNGIKLSVGMKNRHDYSDVSFDEVNRG